MKMKCIDCKHLELISEFPPEYKCKIGFQIKNPRRKEFCEGCEEK